jgi:hypothetical protein
MKHQIEADIRQAANQAISRSHDGIRRVKALAPGNALQLSGHGRKVRVSRDA